MDQPARRPSPATEACGGSGRTTPASAPRTSAQEDQQGRTFVSQDKPSQKDLGPSAPGGKASLQKREKRSFKAQGLSRLIPKILKDGLGRKGSLEADLLIHWRDVVGEELSQWTVPSKISYADRRMRRKGTLTLAVNPAYAQFAQMAEGEILANVNQFLGFGRIEKIHLKQSYSINSVTNRTSVTGRGVTGRSSVLENRRERRQNGDLDSALEQLRQNVAERDRRR